MEGFPYYPKSECQNPTGKGLIAEMPEKACPHKAQLIESDRKKRKTIFGFGVGLEWVQCGFGSLSGVVAVREDVSLKKGCWAKSRVE